MTESCFSFYLRKHLKISFHSNEGIDYYITYILQYHCQFHNGNRFTYAKPQSLYIQNSSCISLSIIEQNKWRFYFFYWNQTDWLELPVAMMHWQFSHFHYSTSVELLAIFFLFCLCLQALPTKINKSKSITKWVINT